MPESQQQEDGEATRPAPEERDAAEQFPMVPEQGAGPPTVHEDDARPPVREKPIEPG